MADRLIVLDAELSLRDATRGDRDFLRRLYASTRADELALVPWGDAEKLAFTDQQFHAQDAAYHEAYPEGLFLLVQLSDEPIGRLYVARLPGELRLIDITIEAARRGQGLGTRLVEWVISLADSERRAVTLHVEPWNRAKHLYERVGLATVEMRGIYEFMRRPPAGQLKTAS